MDTRRPIDKPKAIIKRNARVTRAFLGGLYIEEVNLAR
jgi:hypothetical protein